MIRRRESVRHTTRLYVYTVNWIYRDCGNKIISFKLYGILQSNRKVLLTDILTDI